MIRLNIKPKQNNFNYKLKNWKIKPVINQQFSIKNLRNTKERIKINLLPIYSLKASTISIIYHYVQDQVQ